MVMRDPISSEVASAKQRLINLERRFRDLKLVKFFNDLGDVPPFDPRFEDHIGDMAEVGNNNDLVVWGVAERSDDQALQWQPVRVEAGGGGGPYASISVTGLYDGTTHTDVDLEWMTATSGYELTVVSGGGLPGPRAIGVTVPGIYMVTGSVLVTQGSGFPAVTIRMYSASAAKWQMGALDNNDCREPLEAGDDAADAGAASLMMPLAPSVASALIEVAVDNADEVRWRLQAHLVHPAPVLDGACAE